MGAISLLFEKRFLPLFVSQFLGAFNDNLIKNIVALVVTFRAATEAEAGSFVNMAGGLFILPYFLFSPIAGQISDKFDKARVVRIIKLCEIPVMGLAALGFYIDSLPVLMLTIFLVGTLGAFFSPAKYGLLPEHLEERELTSGNALISISVFIAIICGLVMASSLVGGDSLVLASIASILMALVGWLVSHQIPSARPPSPELRLNFNPVAEVVSAARSANRIKSVRLSILAIGWLWFLGATILSQLPAFAKYVLYGAEAMATMTVLVFVIGISLGALVCMALSRGEIELGLVPLGAIGLTLFGVDLALVDYTAHHLASVTVADFLFKDTSWQNWRSMIDLAGIGFSASLYAIPLNALIQFRADEAMRSRVISATNILSSLFMIGSALTTFWLYQADCTVLEIFAFVFIANALVGLYIFTVIPEFVMRFVTWLLASTIYRIRYEGRDHLPRRDAVLVVANQLRAVDWLLITAACRRPVRFVVSHVLYRRPFLGWLLRLAKAIPLPPSGDADFARERTFERISQELRAGHIVCLFPEQPLVNAIALSRFQNDIEAILANDPVPIVPLALIGLTSSAPGAITVKIGRPLPSSDFEKIVQELIA